MRALVWNNELEAVAQRWADQCTFGHDSVSIVMTMVIGDDEGFGGDDYLYRNTMKLLFVTFCHDSAMMILIIDDMI